MNTETITYPSQDGTSTIRALLWTPDRGPARPPRGIVQLVHGMSEHVERYAGFAEFLADQGFAVAANDHVGHGKSAANTDDLGHMPLEAGEDVLLGDVHTLRCTLLARAQAKFPDSYIPYIIFGHSMGSFVVRDYLTRYAKGISAAIICGTGQQSKLMAKGGHAVVSAIAAVKGERYRSKLAHSLGDGGYAKQIENAQTPVDWICTDPEVVAEYQRDPLCGQMFTVGAYAALADLVASSIDEELAKKIPSKLPMFFIAGAGDPVGEFGAGVERAAEEYRQAGISDVQVKIYPNVRHEILNEPIKDQVHQDILSYLEAHNL